MLLYITGECCRRNCEYIWSIQQSTCQSSAISPQWWPGSVTGKLKLFWCHSITGQQRIQSSQSNPLRLVQQECFCVSVLNSVIIRQTPRFSVKIWRSLLSSSFFIGIYVWWIKAELILKWFYLCIHKFIWFVTEYFAIDSVAGLPNTIIRDRKSIIYIIIRRSFSGHAPLFSTTHSVRIPPFQ